MDRLTFRTDLGVSIDKNEDCPICSICWDCNIPPKNCNYINDALEKLARYEDLEEEGLLVKIPCKLGDTVYVVGSKCLANIVPDEECKQMECESCKYDGEYVVFNRIADRHFMTDLLFEKDNNFIFGSTVFSTYEEALERLKRLIGK